MTPALSRLLKICGTYFGAAVFVLERFNRLTQPLELPTWIYWGVTLLVVAGLPVAALVALYTVRADPDIETDPWMEKAPRILTAAAVAIVAVGGGGIAWWVFVADGGVPIPAVARDGPAVAVMPFSNQSPNPSDAFFAEGLTGELTRVFTQVPGIRVMDGEFAVGSKDLADAMEAARARGATTVLEGAVQKAGKRIRVTAQLLDVDDGSVLWTDRYDRELEDVFALQDELSAAIVQALAPTVAQSKAAPSFDWGTQDADAYEHYLRGRVLADAAATPEERGAAAEAFRAALAADPDFAAARAALDALTDSGASG